jgi:hypothetical protein
MPLKFWDEAFLAATYLINRLPTKILDFPLLLNDCFMRNQIIVGCEPLVVVVGLIFDPSTHKLQFRLKQCVFLGYSNLHKCFKCLDVAVGRVYISCDVIFDETVFPFSKLNPNASTHLRSKILLLPSHAQPFMLPRLGVNFWMIHVQMCH